MVLTGSCPWPGPWFRTYGAHLHLQAREDPHPTAVAVPSALLMNVASEKKSLREAARSRRGALARACPDFAHRIVAHADALQAFRGTMISGYIAMGNEADPAPLIARLRAQGCEISYPLVHRGQPLTFRVPVEGEQWIKSAFGVLEPRPDWPLALPTLLLVPLLAFDKDGYRLGYGGGYYDRTLAHFRAEREIAAIGIAFAGQQMERVPRDARDEPLDGVVTEEGFRRFETG
jgi:5-formyltetrahydrofolate cyclo-ligase